MSAAVRSWAWIAGVVAVLVLGLSAYPAFALRDLPDPHNQSGLAGSILVYDRTGKVLGERNSQGQYHVFEHLSQMGRWGPEATLAAEDRSFYSHGPIDTGALIRAAAADVFAHRLVEGGSSITQQLVKLQLLGPQRTFSRKLEEAYLAWALERRYSKDEILEMYLNRVYYGHQAYGLPAAAKVYFGAAKEPRDLTPAQAAFLAGLVSGPSTNDPRTNWPGARARELYVLNGLVSMGRLSRAQADTAAAEDIRGELRYDTSYRVERAPHFVDYVLRVLENEYGPEAVQHGGWSIYTTLDPGLQGVAERAVADGVHALSGRGVNNGALLALRPRTGEVLAWVGSADFANDAIGGQYDIVSLAHRQPGSSFKPYVYEAALRDHKISLCTILHDQPTDFGGYSPVDYDNSYLGDMTARQALVLSRNIPAVEVAQKEGIQNVIALAQAMGISTRLDPSLPTAIGASDVTMFDHAQGYSVFADQGTKMPVMAITRIVDPSGNVVFQREPGTQPGQQVLTAAQAYLITDTLKDYQDQWSLGWNRRMAGKSGTTGGAQAGIHRDAWMMAYNPNIVVAAWAGNTAASGAGQSISAFGTEVGSTMSAEFINALPSSYSGWYQVPPGIKQNNGEIMLADKHGHGNGNGSPPPSIAPDCSGSPDLETPPPQDNGGGGD